MTGMKRPPAPPAAPDLGTALDALQHAGALFRRGHFLDAAAIYRDVIRRRPRLPAVHNTLGVALKAAGHATDAVPCFRPPLRRTPDYVPPHRPQHPTSERHSTRCSTPARCSAAATFWTRRRSTAT